MSISIRWYDNKRTIILYTFYDGWTWQDFAEAGKTGNRLMDRVQHGVILLYDLRDMAHFPPNIFSEAYQALNLPKHPLLQATIVVSVPESFKPIHQLLRRIIPDDVYKRWGLHFVDAFDDAFAIINQITPHIGEVKQR